MSTLRVLVVGASIAGPTAAYWLAKAGAAVTVIERFPSLRTSGQAVDIRTVGVEVMRKMPGMEAAVRAKTTTLEGMSFVRDDGRPYGIIRATGDPEQQSLVSEYEIFRGGSFIVFCTITFGIPVVFQHPFKSSQLLSGGLGDLSRIIFDMTKDNENIRYIFNEQVASLQQSEKEEGPIQVEFANGTPTTECKSRKPGGN